MIKKEIKVFYLPGAGGNWVNYLVWCWVKRKYIPGKHLHFSQEILREVDSNYGVWLTLLPHDRPWQEANIILGHERALFNWRLINNLKNDPTKSLDDTFNNDYVYQPYDPNLQWRLIVENPPEFLKQLNSFLPVEIQYTDLIRQVFLQYIESCYPEQFQGLEYRNTKAYKNQIRRLQSVQGTEGMTDIRPLRVAAKKFDQNWIVWDPATWKF